MAIGTDARIFDSLRARLSSLTLTPALQIAWPNVAFTPPASGTYLAASFLPAEPSPVGIASWDEYPGIFQVDVVSTSQAGIGPLLELAHQIAAWFPRNLKLPYCTIYDTPAIAAPIADPPWSRIPVSIRYRAFVR